MTTDGLATLTFFTTGENAINFDLPYEGHFWVENMVDLSGMEDGETIQFPGLETKITIHRPEDYEIEKKNVDGVIKKDADGNNYIEYKVTVTSKNGTGSNKLTISDIINPENGIKGDYDVGSFELKKKAKDGTETKIKVENGTAFADEDAEEGETVQTVSVGIGDNEFVLPDLPPLKEGESYTLTYRYRLSEDSALDGKVKNTATVKKDGDDTGETATSDKTFKKMLEKTYQNYDKDSERVQWVITIRNPEKDSLAGQAVTDTISSAAAKILGNVQIKWGETEDCTSGPRNLTQDEIASENALFEYKFSAKNQESDNAAYYKIIYTTTVPTGLENLKNEAEWACRKAEAALPLGENNVRDWDASKKPQNSTDFKTMSDGTSQMSWYATVKPKSGKTEFTVTDTFFDPVDDTNNSNKKVGDHYAYYGKLKSLLEGDNGILQFFFTQSPNKDTAYSLAQAKEQGVDVKVAYYALTNNEASTDDENRTYTKIEENADTNTKVKQFKITVDFSQSNLGNVYKLNIGTESKPYYSYVDLTNATTANQWNIKNVARIADGRYFSTGSYKKYMGANQLDKYVGNFSTAMNNQTSANFTLTNQGKDSAGKDIWSTDVWYGFRARTDFSTDTITITDTLPKGLVFDKDATDSYWARFQRGSNYNKDSLKEYVNPYDSLSWNLRDYLTVNTKTGEDGKQTVTFTISGIQSIPENLRTFDAILIAFKTKVQDSAWDDYRLTSKPYANSASWNGGAQMPTATATVKRPGTVYANKTYTKDEKDGDKITYTIDVNPQDNDLLPGDVDEITLTDTFTVPKGVTAEIMRESIKWLDGVTNADKKDEYNKDFVIQNAVNNADGSTTYTMVFTIPDDVHLKIQYTYKLAFAENVRGNVKVTNRADLHGQTNESISTDVAVLDGGASSGTDGKLTVYKVKKGDFSTVVPGACFTLERYDNGNWTTVKTDIVTDAQGRMMFSTAGTANIIQIEPNKLYRLKETKAPLNYLVNGQPQYFIWMKDAASQEEALHKATDNADTVADMSEEEIASINYAVHGKNNAMQIEDTFNTKLTLTKKWADCLGEPLEAAPELEVKFKLFCKSIADPDAGYELVTANVNKETVASEVTLNQANNWTYQWDNLDPAYTYMVEEEPIAGGNEEGYQPVYTYSDGVDDTLTNAPYNGTITVTNREKPGLPMVMKKVKENVKTTNASGTETDVHVPGYAIPEQYNDVADYSIGDAVPFQLVGTLPEDLGLYTKGYYYQFVDEQAEGLTLNENSVKVTLKKMDGTEAADLTEAANVEKTDKGFTVTFGDLLTALGDKADAVKKEPLGYIIVVDYTAALNADANIGLPGNENSVYLNYADEPEKPAERDTTAVDRVIVFTYQLTTTKVDENNAALSGVEFVLSRKDGEAKEYALLDESAHVTGWTTDAKKATPLVSGEDGVLQAIGLDDGTYYLTETSPRPGYNALFEDIEVVVGADTVHSQTWEGEPTAALTGLNVSVKNAQNAAADADTGTVKVSIVNSKGTMLPSTGGRGTTVYYVVGGTLMAAAAVGLVLDRKRRSKQ